MDAEDRNIAIVIGMVIIAIAVIIALTIITVNKAQSAVYDDEGRDTNRSYLSNVAEENGFRDCYDIKEGTHGDLVRCYVDDNRQQECLLFNGDSFAMSCNWEKQGYN